MSEQTRKYHFLLGGRDLEKDEPYKMHNKLEVRLTDKNLVLKET